MGHKSILFAEFGNFYFPSFAPVLLHLTEELLDVFLLHDFLAGGEFLEVFHEVGLHGVVGLDGLNLFDPIQLREGFHPIFVLRSWENRIK